MMAALDKARHSVLLSFMLLALFGGWAIRTSADSDAQKLYKGQLRLCLAGNKLILSEANKRLKFERDGAEIVSDFLAAARTARLASGTGPDLAAATEYQRLIRVIDTTTIGPRPQAIACTKAVEKP